MRRCVVVFVLVAFLMSAWALLAPAPAAADVFGLGPTLIGGETKTVLPASAQKQYVPSRIVGLETYSLYGDDAGAAAVVSWKRTFGHWTKGHYDLDLRAGIIGGIKVGGDDSAPIYGIFGEIEAARLGGIVLVVRADGGRLRLNPGFKLNLVSVSF